LRPQHRHADGHDRLPRPDFCGLANAGTISVARDIQKRFDDLDYLYDLGEIEIKCPDA